MIQRIQSLYMMLAALAASLVFVFSFGEILVTQGTYVLTAFDIHLVNAEKEEIIRTLLLPMILTAVVILGSVAAIFLYSNRKMQLRVVQLVMLVDAGLLGAVFYYQKETEELAGAMMHYNFGVVMPIIALIFLILATRGISKDEELVRSTERLR